MGYLGECDVLRSHAERRVRDCLGETVTVTGRTKSTDTLRDKLIRTPTIQLPSIDDVIGVRIVGEITLSQQDAIAQVLQAEFGGTARTRDRRAEPSAGYRALHVVVKVDGARVEIQVRSRLQAEWADLFERLADRWGRQIRYGEDPDPDPDGQTDARRELISRLQQLSVEFIANYESALDRAMADDGPIAGGRLRPSAKLSRKDIALAMRIRESDKKVAIATQELKDALDEWRRVLLDMFDQMAEQATITP